MNDASVADVLAKLRLLEERLGHLTHRPLAPFGLIPSDPVNLQRAARRLAGHVGLGELTWVVAIARQAETVGGHVELRYAQREVFIELDGVLVDHPETALTALAHEVTHKLLHQHDVWIEPTLENERLTDLAALYAGFGAIMLNGCESTRVELVSGGQNVEQIKGGYLDRDELGLAFAALEYLRPGDNGRDQLSAEADQAVTRGERRLASIWPRPDRRESLIAEIRDSIRAEQAALAAIAKDLTYLRDHALPALEALGQRAHRRLCAALGELGALEAGGSDRVDALRAAGLALERARSREAVGRGSAVSRARKQSRKATAALESIEGLPARTAEMFRLVRCPIDGARLRIPAHKRRIAVRCPRCSYRFIADSTLGDPEVAVKKKRQGWLWR